MEQKQTLKYANSTLADQEKQVKPDNLTVDTNFLRTQRVWHEIQNTEWVWMGLATNGLLL